MADLPFQVGELIESKYFIDGYRGAWFRCRILKIVEKYGRVSYQLDYPDYPDEKSIQFKVYQKDPHINKSKGLKSLNKELMVRPRFPTIYRESEKLDVNAISEMVVIVDDTLKIGDLVDWFSDGCYWSGKVTELFETDKVQIDLLPPPHGEGCSYEAFSKDLRPSLDWCPQNGWTVPTPKEGCRCPARIMNPANLGNIVNITAATDGAVNVDQPSSKSMETREHMDIEVADNKNGRTSFSDIISTSHNSDASIEILESTPINRHDDEYPSKKRMRTSSNLCLNSTSSNTTDSAILDLEELLNRVKWLRCVLKCEVPLSGAKRPSWQFSQHHASCN